MASRGARGGGRPANGAGAGRPRPGSPVHARAGVGPRAVPGVARGRGPRHGIRPANRRRRLQVLPHPLAPALAAEPGLAVAAEPGGGVEAVGAVHPHRAGLDPRCHLQREAQLLGPDAGGQPVARVVGQRDGLGGGAEAQAHQDGPEDLLGHDGTRRRRPDAQGGGHEETVVRDRPVGLPDRRAVGSARLQVSPYAVQLRPVHQRAHVDRLVQGVSHPQALHPAAEAVVHLLLHALLHQQPRAGATDLSLVEPDPVHHAFDGGVKVRALEDHEGGLAAQLQRQAPARPGGDAPDLASHLGGAGEGDLGDARVPHQRRAGLAVSGDDVQHPRGQTGLLRDLREEQSGEGRVLRRLEDHRVGGGQGGRDLPGQHEQGEVPGDDLPHHAHRFVARELVVEQLGPPGVVMEVTGGEGDVQIAGFAHRLAVVEGLDHGEETRPLLDLPRKSVEVAGATVGTDPPPLRQRGGGRGDGAVHIRGGSLAKGGQPAAIRGAPRPAHVAVAVRPAPADEVAEGALAVPEPLVGDAVALRRGPVAGTQKGVPDRRHGGLAGAGHARGSRGGARGRRHGRARAHPRGCRWNAE